LLSEVCQNQKIFQRLVDGHLGGLVTQLEHAF